MNIGTVGGMYNLEEVSNNLRLRKHALSYWSCTKEILLQVAWLKLSPNISYF